MTFCAEGFFEVSESQSGHICASRSRTLELRIISLAILASVRSPDHSASAELFDQQE